VIHLLTGAEQFAGETVEVEGPDYNHLFRARRLRVGARVRLVDGRGSARWSVVEEITAKRGVLRVEGPAPVAEPARKLVLCVSVVRPERAAWLVEKTTELGLRHLQWFVSERTNRSFSARVLDRQARIARSALEQSAGAWLPEIGAPVALDQIRLTAGAVVLHPGAGTTFPSVAPSAPSVVIGPEGGFSEREIEDLSRRGAVPAHLGPRILRTETAAVVAAGLILCS